MTYSWIRRATFLATGAALVAAATAACNVEVISDGEGGEGGEGGAGGYGNTDTATATTATGQTSAVSGNTTGVVATTVGTTATTTVSTYAAVTTVATTGTGGCPPDPVWNDCGVGSASAGTGMATTCDLTYCDQGPNDESFERHCTTETGTCTCTQGADTCTCAWNGDCSTPCCGPDGPL